MDKKIEVPTSISDAIYNTTEMKPIVSKQTTEILDEKEVQEINDNYDLANEIADVVIDWLREVKGKRIGFLNTFKLVMTIVGLIKAKKR